MVFPAKTWDVCPTCWLVVSTHLKNNSQIGNLPQIGVNIKKIFETTPETIHKIVISFFNHVYSFFII